MNHNPPSRKLPAPGVYLTRAVIGLWFFFYSAVMFTMDGRSGHWHVGATLLIALYCVFLPPRPLFGGVLYTPVAGLLLWFAAIAAIECSLPPRCSGTIAQEDGAWIITQLHTYHREHGRYPAALEAAGIHSPIYRCGPFQYHTEKDGHCSLEIGDYNLDGFVATWSSRSREWWTDS